MDTAAEDISFRQQLSTLWKVCFFRPLLTAGIISLSVFAALMEGVGLSFLIPIIETAQGNTNGEDMNRVGQIFVQIFDFLGLPFIIEFVIIGAILVLGIRYATSFLVEWMKYSLRIGYQRHLQKEAFEKALAARTGYFDRKGSDEMMNGIVTQARQGAAVIGLVVQLVQQMTLSLVYLAITLYIAPMFTLLALVLLGSVAFVIRWGVESAYSIGDREAKANELVHEAVQVGTQGIRDIRVFQLSEEIYAEFETAVDLFRDAAIKSGRNQAAMDNLYQLTIATSVFGLLYVAVTILSLSFAELGVFLFALFRLTPRVSTLNNITYKAAGKLPHLVRTHELIDELEEAKEVDEGDKSPPADISEVAFENVTFAYDEDIVLDGISFDVSDGEFVAFVGASGAGKSTIVSLLTRLYVPESGQITANGQPIDQFGREEWREAVSLVRQDPFIFNETLRYNVTVGDRDATEAEIREACELAQVTEFLDELPDGLDTILGDDGVRLSGGQRQRIAVARALLKDSDILILDEATSDLDTSLENEIQANLEGAEDDRILIVIAHRLSTVVNADRIYVMEEGRISEKGRHDELVGQDGMYAELYGSQ